jgi:hypothetical protein
MAVAPVHSLTAATGVATGTALDNTTSATFHRMTVTMASYAGSGAVEVVAEASLDNSAWVPIGNAVVDLTGNGTVSVPDIALLRPFPTRYLRARIVSWPATVTAGSVDAWVCSSG